VAQATIGANRVTLEGHGFDIGDVRLVQLHDLRQYVDGSTRFPNLLEGWTS
jgi:hypothetical protein